MPTLPNYHTKEYELRYNKAHRSNYMVVKGNHLVQDTRIAMPLADQKVLASLIRSIKPGQKSLMVKFSTKQFMQMLGMYHTHTNFMYVMRSLNNILNDNFMIRNQDGSYDSWVWLDHIHADPHGKGNFEVTFKQNLRKYLFNQSLKYRTLYKFSDIMLMRSQYSPRLYEIFRSNQSRQKVQKRGLNYTIKELKLALDLIHRNSLNHPKHDKHGNIKFKYPRFTDFRRKVIDPAIREINRYTEFNVKVTPLRKGQKPIAVNVVMLKKNKKQRAKRDDLIFCITHHIPKSQWKNWRKNMEDGTFYKVNSRKHKDKIVNGKFHVLNHGEQLKKELKKHPVPMQEIDMSGGRVEYYSPLVHKYVWTDRNTFIKQRELYQQQQEMIKEMEKQNKE